MNKTVRGLYEGSVGKWVEDCSLYAYLTPADAILTLDRKSGLEALYPGLQVRNFN